MQKTEAYAQVRTSNSNHILKSAVNIRVCMLKRGWVWVNSSRENEARFLHQYEVNLRDRETKWLHAFAQAANANTKLDLRSPIVDRDKVFLSLCLCRRCSHLLKRRLCLCLCSC